MILNDCTVLEFSNMVPGPFATRLLSDLGAEVIKVESVDGGDTSRQFEYPFQCETGSVFQNLNAGKQSIAIDLKSEKGQELIQAMAEKCDVVVNGYPASIADRLHIDYSSLAQINEELVYCSISGFGEDSSMSDRIAHDLNYVAMSGFLSLNRHEGDPPALPGYPLAGMVTGIYTALASIAGLARPSKKSVEIEITVMEAMLSLGEIFVPSVQNNGLRSGKTFITGRLPWYNIYKTSDGQYVTLAILEYEYWKSFCKEVEAHELINLFNAADAAERKAAKEQLGNIFSSRTKEAWESVFSELNIPGVSVYTLEEILNSQYTQDRKIKVGDTQSRLAPPLLINNQRPTSTGSAPKLGEHTRKMLIELGYDQHAINNLAKDNIIQYRG